LIFCFVSFLVSLALLFFIPNSFEINLAVFLAAIAMFFNYFSWTFRPIFQAHGKLKYEAISRIIERVVAFTLGAFFIVILRKGILYIMVALIISYIVFYISRVYFAKVYCEIKFSFNFGFMKKMLVKSLPFWFTILCFKLYFTMDTLMLSWLTHDYAVVGLYNAAYKILEGFRFIPAIAGLVLFPVMSKLFIKDKTKLESLLKVSTKYLFMIVVPLVISVIFLADKFIVYLYTDNFTKSILILQILIIAGGLNFISYIFGYFLQATNKQTPFAFVVAFGTIVNITLNFFLIPHYSYIGAAMATVVTEIICFVLFYALIWRMNFRIALIRMVPPILLAGAAMGGCLYYIKDNHLIILAPIGISVYFTALFLFGSLRQKEFDLFNQIIKRGDNN